MVVVEPLEIGFSSGTFSGNVGVASSRTLMGSQSRTLIKGSQFGTLGFSNQNPKVLNSEP